MTMMSTPARAAAQNDILSDRDMLWKITGRNAKVAATAMTEMHAKATAAMSLSRLLIVLIKSSIDFR